MEEVQNTAVITPDGSVAGTLLALPACQPEAPLLVCIHGGGCNGQYFDLKGRSMARAALQRGMPVLLVDRPGYGRSMPRAYGSPIALGAAAVRALITVVREESRELAGRPVAIIGHSIGGAVALTFAADRSAEPPAVLCVSGIGDRPTPEVAAFAQYGSARPRVEPPAYWFFGPERTYGWQGVTALRRASEPWRTDEVDEVISVWPARWQAIAGAIRCPVHFRLAEFERIWETTPQALSRIASSFTRTSADAAILPDGGHLYEVHRRGAELIDAQLDFVWQQVTCR